MARIPTKSSSKYSGKILSPSHDPSEIVYDALACDVENEFVGAIQRDDYIIFRKFSYSSLDKVFSFIKNKLEEIRL